LRQELEPDSEFVGAIDELAYKVAATFACAGQGARRAAALLCGACLVQRLVQVGAGTCNKW
jgi:hypothetical protein